MAADHRDGPAVTFELATSEDLEALRLAATRAFEADINYGAPAVGGPPGYNTVAWHQSFMRQATEYYKIVADHRVVGGFTVFAMGCDLCVLGTIYIVPEFQNQGIGRRAIEFRGASTRTRAAGRWRRRGGTSATTTSTRASAYGAWRCGPPAARTRASCTRSTCGPDITTVVV